MKILAYLVLGMVALAVTATIAGQGGLFAGTAPTNLGVREGRLNPPSPNPNSVSSQASLYPDHPQREYADITPLSFTGSADAAMEKLSQLLQNTERTIVIQRGPHYIYAQCSTVWLKFTDDVEFWLDKPNGVIQVRSASRLGRSDFGVNRARIESIRAQFSP